MTYRVSSVDISLKKADAEGLARALKALSAYEVAGMMNLKSDAQQLMIFNALSPEQEIKAFDYLSPRTQRILVSTMPLAQTAKILKSLSPDDRTALLETLPRSVVDEYIKLLPYNERLLTLSLLGYPSGSIGRLMTTDYIAVNPDWTVEEVLEHIREYGHYSETIDVIYVVDYHDKLMDDIQLKDFLFVPKNHVVHELMDSKVVSLNPYDTDEKAIATFKQYDRTALPVMGEEGEMLGIVTIDDILRLSEKENTADMQKMGGMEALSEPYLKTPFFDLMKKRGGWLTILFFGEMLTATAMSYFEHEIAQAVVLTLFLPLILSSGGNSGSQAATLIIRAMTLGELRLKDWWNVLKREILSGLFLGGMLGAFGALRVIIWGSAFHSYGDHWLLLSIAIFLSVMGVVLWSTMVGSMLPLILQSLKFDPATSSTPCIATLVDVTGILLYFGISMLILQGSLLA